MAETFLDFEFFLPFHDNLLDKTNIKQAIIKCLTIDANTINVLEATQIHKQRITVKGYLQITAEEREEREEQFKRAIQNRDISKQLSEICAVDTRIQIQGLRLTVTDKHNVGAMHIDESVNIKRKPKVSTLTEAHQNDLLQLYDVDKDEFAKKAADMLKDNADKFTIMALMNDQSQSMGVTLTLPKFQQHFSNELKPELSEKIFQCMDASEDGTVGFVAFQRFINKKKQFDQHRSDTVLPADAPAEVVQYELADERLERMKLEDENRQMQFELADQKLEVIRLRRLSQQLEPSQVQTILPSEKRDSIAEEELKRVQYQLADDRLDKMKLEKKAKQLEYQLADERFEKQRKEAAAKQMEFSLADDRLEKIRLAKEAKALEFKLADSKMENIRLKRLSQEISPMMLQNINSNVSSQAVDELESELQKKTQSLATVEEEMRRLQYELAEDRFEKLKLRKAAKELEFKLADEKMESIKLRRLSQTITQPLGLMNNLSMGTNDSQLEDLLAQKEAKLAQLVQEQKKIQHDLADDRLDKIKAEEKAKRLEFQLADDRLEKLKLESKAKQLEYQLADERFDKQRREQESKQLQYQLADERLDKHNKNEKARKLEYQLADEKMENTRLRRMSQELSGLTPDQLGLSLGRTSSDDGRMADMEAEVKRKQDELERILEEKKRLEYDLAEERMTNIKVKRRASQIGLAITADDLLVDEDYQHPVELQGELNRLQAELEQEREIKEALLKKNPNSVAQELSSTKNELNRTRQEKTRAARESKILKDEVDTLRSEIDKMVDQELTYDELLEKVKHLERENEVLEQEIAQMQQERDIALEEVKRLKHQLGAANAANQDDPVSPLAGDDSSDPKDTAIRKLSNQLELVMIEKNNLQKRLASVLQRREQIQIMWDNPRIHVRLLADFVEKLPANHREKVWSRYAGHDLTADEQIFNLLFSLLALAIKVQDRNAEAPSKEELRPRVRNIIEFITSKKLLNGQVMTRSQFLNEFHEWIIEPTSDVEMTEMEQEQLRAEIEQLRGQLRDTNDEKETIRRQSQVEVMSLKEHIQQLQDHREEVETLQTMREELDRVSREKSDLELKIQNVRSKRDRLSIVWDEPRVHVRVLSDFIQKLPLNHREKVWSRYTNEEDLTAEDHLFNLIFSLLALAVKVQERHAPAPTRDVLRPKIQPLIDYIIDKHLPDNVLMTENEFLTEFHLWIQEPCVDSEMSEEETYQLEQEISDLRGQLRSVKEEKQRIRRQSLADLNSLREEMQRMNSDSRASDDENADEENEPKHGEDELKNRIHELEFALADEQYRKHEIEKQSRQSITDLRSELNHLRGELTERQGSDDELYAPATALTKARESEGDDEDEDDDSDERKDDEMAQREVEFEEERMEFSVNDEHVAKNEMYIGWKNKAEKYSMELDSQRRKLRERENSIAQLMQWKEESSKMQTLTEENVRWREQVETLRGELGKFEKKHQQEEKVRRQSIAALHNNMFSKLLMAEAEHEDIVTKYKGQISELHNKVTEIQRKAEKYKNEKLTTQDDLAAQVNEHQLHLTDILAEKQFIERQLESLIENKMGIVQSTSNTIQQLRENVRFLSLRLQLYEPLS